MHPHPLTNFEIQKYYQIEPRFNGVCSRNNLPEIKEGAYVTSLDEYKSIGTSHWIALFVNGHNGRVYYNATYFGSFRVKHIPKEIKKFIGNKSNYLQNSSIRFNNVQTLLHCIY